jgi:hypothetical protein
VEEKKEMYKVGMVWYNTYLQVPSNVPLVPHHMVPYIEREERERAEKIVDRRYFYWEVHSAAVETPGT